MTSRELTEWMLFAEIEPFGGDADHLGSAIVAATVANRHRNKNEKVHKLEEFIPRRRKEQTEEEMIQIAEVMTAAMGGVDKRER